VQQDAGAGVSGNDIGGRAADHGIAQALLAVEPGLDAALPVAQRRAAGAKPDVVSLHNDANPAQETNACARVAGDDVAGGGCGAADGEVGRPQFLDAGPAGEGDGAAGVGANEVARYQVAAAAADRHTGGHVAGDDVAGPGDSAAHADTRGIDDRDPDQLAEQ